MEYREYINNQFLSSNWIGAIPMPPRRDFRSDKKELAQDRRNVGKSILFGVNKVRKCLAK